MSAASNIPQTPAVSSNRTPDAATSEVRGAIVPEAETISRLERATQDVSSLNGGDSLISDSAHRSKLEAPNWIANSTIPWKTEELVQQNGSPTFRILEELLPAKGMLAYESVKFNVLAVPFVLPTELEAQKQRLIEDRQAINRRKDADALARWEAQGSIGERPLPTLFFNRTLAREVPGTDIQLSQAGEDQELHIQVGATSYFDYVASRTSPALQYSADQVAMPLACCGTVIVSNRSGERFLLYTVRENSNESYPGFFHLLGSMPALGATDNYHISDRWVEDVLNEAPFKPTELILDGILGVAEDMHFRHTEVCHAASLNVPLEEVFEHGPGRTLLIRQDRNTDQQVTLRAIPWEPKVVQGLILGNLESDPDPRPWVNTGLANLLLAGRTEFGEAWYQETRRAYNDQLQFILQNPR